jgi:hypothetical protein
MSPTQITPEIASPDAPVGLATKPRVVVAADADDVMREQLEFLIEHAQAGDCGCPQCNRYHRVRTLLLEAFTEAPPTEKRAVASMR